MKDVDVRILPQKRIKELLTGRIRYTLVDEEPHLQQPEPNKAAPKAELLEANADDYTEFLPPVGMNKSLGRKASSAIDKMLEDLDKLKESLSKSDKVQDLENCNLPKLLAYIPASLNVPLEAWKTKKWGDNVPGPLYTSLLNLIKALNDLDMNR